MSDIHFVERVTDYGAEQVLLKKGNKILGWTENYPENTAAYNERGKWFWCVGNPNQVHYETTYKVNDKEDGKKVLMELYNSGGLV